MRELGREVVSGLVLLAVKNNEYFETSDPLITGTISFLRRKGLIDSKLNITEKGEKFIEDLNSTEVKKETIKIPIDVTDDFEEWWKIHPSTNAFTYKGVDFTGSQAKKKDKVGCKKIFKQLVLSGISAKDIIEATRIHVDMAKEGSFKHKTRENQVSYIPNSRRYLDEKCFEPYLQFIKKKIFTNSNIVDV